MNFLSTLQYDTKRRRMLDSSGYPAMESTSITNNTAIMDTTSPDTVFGINDTKVLVRSSEPVIAAISSKSSNASIGLCGEGTGVAKLVDQKLNYLKIGSTTGQVIVNATSDTNTNVSLALQPKGSGIIQVCDPSDQHLELSNASIKASASGATTSELYLYSMGSSGTQTFKSTNNDSFVFTPGNGTSSISVTSTTTDANLELNPLGTGTLILNNRFLTSGDMPNFNTVSDASGLIENTNAGQTSTLMVSSNNNVAYLSWDIAGINGRSLGLGTNGELYLQDQWRIDAGSTLFRINTDGQISQTTLRPTFQSGSYTTGSTGWERITFTRTFASTPAVVGIVKHTTTSRVRICGIKNVGPTGFDVKAWTTNTDGVSAWVGSITTVYWFAAVPTQ